MVPVMNVQTLKNPEKRICAFPGSVSSSVLPGVLFSGFSSSDFAQELRTCISDSGHPGFIILPAIDCEDDLLVADMAISDAERGAEIEVGTVKLIAGLGSVAAVMAVFEIAGASSRLSGLLLQTREYLSALGAVRTSGGQELVFSRARVVHAARMAGLDALEWLDADERTFSFKESSEQIGEIMTAAREIGQMGFQGIVVSGLELE